MISAPKLILGIPTLNRYDLLEKLIVSAEAGSLKPTTYLIVDNGRRLKQEMSGSAGIADALHRGARMVVLEPDRNLGVSASWNEMLDWAGPTPLIISNDDVELGLDTLERMTGALEIHDFVIADGGYNADGWCLFGQSTECTERVGRYDEGFFPAYCEDRDYEIRMRAAKIFSYRVETKFHHEGWATMDRDPAISDGQRKSIERFQEKWGRHPDSETASSAEPMIDSVEERRPVNSEPSSAMGTTMRWDIINHIVDTIGAKTYLEIGVCEGESMRHVRGLVCDLEKWGVDPAPRHGAREASDHFFTLGSDEFFAARLSGQTFDVVFVDGLHLADQAYRDIMNAAECARVVVAHDSNPSTEQMQTVPAVQSEWTGDVWKAVARIRAEGRHLVRTVDTDYGVAVIIPNRGENIESMPRDTWHDLVNGRAALLGLIETDEWQEWFDEAARPKIRASDLDLIRLVAKLQQFVAGPNSSDFFKKNEHYRLLALLSTRVPPGKPIIDIGTCYGDSALALSYSGHAVHSFDVADMVGDRLLPPEISLNREDLFDAKVREQRKELLLSSGLILIDIAPHDGRPELEMVRWLQANRYEGLIVLDDIWWYKEMRDNLWYQIESEFKTDLTSVGHWSGTGVISFKRRLEFEGEYDTSNWTLVTSYFDLPSRPDASDALRARPPEWYIDIHGSSVLSLDKNLVIFCDPHFEERIWAARPKRLHGRTRIIPVALEDFPLSGSRDRIIQNRGGALTCPSDPRDTATYYLFCMARYYMMKATIARNEFSSTHFCWIDMGIERMGFNNLIRLDEALGQNRDRFSTCFIDYQPRELVENLPEYFGGNACWGRCSMSSGFFTGNAEYMEKFCNLIETEFFACLEAGYGHADEQLYPRIYFRHPEIFEWYCGDYTEVITNYATVREHPESPIQNLIRNSFAAGDYGVCRKACSAILESLAAGNCSLPEDRRRELSQVWEACQ